MLLYLDLPTNNLADFEATFAPELASLSAPLPREPTPTPSWQIQSPIFEHSVPQSGTNGTIATTDTSILDTPSHRPTRQDRSNRLSFLGRNTGNQAKHDPPPVSYKPNGVMVNGNGNAGNGKSEDSGSSRSRSKENKRRSFFGGGPKSESSFDGGDGGDGDWVTDAGTDTLGRGRGRAMTTESSGGLSTTSGPGTANSVGSGVGVVSRVGSVRKRLSMLKLGKKNSKANVLVDTVAEE